MTIAASRTSTRWSSGLDADLIAVDNPAAGEVITVDDGGGAAEVDGAVRAAYEAHLTWSPETAKKVLHNAADTGFGRVHAPETLREFGRSKSIRLPSGVAPMPWWNAVNDVLD